MEYLQTIHGLTPFDELYPYFKQGVGVAETRRKVGEEQFFKIYNDGNHYVGKLVQNGRQNHSAGTKSKTMLDNIFDTFYLLAMQNNLRKRELFDYLKNAIIDNYCDFDGIDKYIEESIERKIHNLHKRLKTFRRKARLNKWTHFVTITYDDKKCDESEFKSKLRRCLANLHTRRGWKYMGVFELAPDTKRLHFHALMFVPQGEMIGTVEEKHDWSTAQHKMQTTHSNTFFADTFGRNDFASLNDMEVKKGNAIDYITKYIAKSGEKILYSRGIPSEVIVKLHYSDIATCLFDFVQKFVLFDDVIDYERDILKKRYTYKQATIFDYGIAI